MNTADARRTAGAGHSNGGRPVSVDFQMLLSLHIYRRKKAAFYPYVPMGFLVRVGYVLHSFVEHVKNTESKHQTSYC